jgi:hypothetical protein
MSWLYSQALVVEYLGENFSDGEQSAPLSGRHTQQAYCAPDKMTDFSRLSRFGMMYKPLTESLGEELLTLYLAAFHAKTLAPQEKAQELMEREAECGEKWLASFVKYDPDSSLWRTHQCSLLGDLEPFSETWPQWGLMRDGECWEQRMLEQTIRGTESGLSPNGVDTFHTPNTTGLDGGSNSRKALKKKLEKFPTPRSCSAMAATITPESAWNEKRNPNLETIVGQRLWPTPQASDCRDRGNMSNPAIQRRAEKGKQLNLSMVAHPTSGQLNPTWVEWLMGWPLEWTDLKPLAMDKSHFVQQQHGES